MEKIENKNCFFIVQNKQHLGHNWEYIVTSWIRVFTALCFLDMLYNIQKNHYIKFFVIFYLLFLFFACYYDWYWTLVFQGPIKSLLIIGSTKGNPLKYVLISNSCPKMVFSSCYQEMIKVYQTFEWCKEMLWIACSANCSCVLFWKGVGDSPAAGIPLSRCW